MHDLRRMGATNVLAERRRTPLRRATLRRMLEIYAERFADPDGRIRATFEIVWLSGWAPHESQQQPLKPGSAKTRLADALRVQEIPAGEKAGQRIELVEACSGRASVEQRLHLAAELVDRGREERAATPDGDHGVFDRGGAALVGPEARRSVGSAVSRSWSSILVLVHHSSVVRCATSGSSAGGIL